MKKYRVGKEKKTFWHLDEEQSIIVVRAFKCVSRNLQVYDGEKWRFVIDHAYTYEPVINMTCIYRVAPKIKAVPHNALSKAILRGDWDDIKFIRYIQDAYDMNNNPEVVTDER